MGVPLLLPQATDDPRLVCWSVGPRLLPRNCPDLQALVADGVLEGFESAPGEVRTRLAVDRSWRADGPRVRTALMAALTGPAPDPDPELSEADLRVAVTRVVEQVVAPVVASHGGGIRVWSVVDGVLTVELSGACEGCPVAGRTLSELVRATVQEHCPQVRQVRSRRPGGTGRLTLPWARRRLG